MFTIFNDIEGIQQRPLMPDFFLEIAVRSRINEIQEDWKPTFLTNEEFTHLVLEAVDGFIMVFSASGHIYYASESIASLLGHLPVSVQVSKLFSHDFQLVRYSISFVSRTQMSTAQIY